MDEIDVGERMKRVLESEIATPRGMNLDLGVNGILQGDELDVCLRVTRNNAERVLNYFSASSQGTLIVASFVIRMLRKE